MNEILELTDKKDVIKLAKALSSETRYKIVKLLMNKKMDISTIAKKMNQTEANTSAQIKFLQEAGILQSNYEPGAHGVRKVCEVTIKKVILNIL